MSEHYELLYVVSIKYVEADLLSVVEKVAGFAKNAGGTITLSNVIGKQKLAYPIKHITQGTYVVVEFDMETEGVKKLDDDLRLKLNNEILRHIIVKKRVKTLAEIEKEKKSAFMQAYIKVNESFRTLFSKLTGGGEGYLSLQNAEDPFAGGLDMFVQFPGKTSRLIAGASGGEQSIAAIVYVLSIQSFMPSPFYVLDEIDAHLDPYYAEKLADLLKEMSSSSQFILVTFKDVVINKAERIFGVYLQDGVSNIVSMRLAEELTNERKQA